MRLLNSLKGFLKKEPQMHTGNIITIEKQTLFDVIVPDIEKVSVEANVKRLIKHSRDKDGSKIYHSTWVEIGGQIVNKRAVVAKVAILCDYHPNGYGSWDEQVTLVNSKKGIYEINWTSYNSCD